VHEAAAPGSDDSAPGSGAASWRAGVA
jgi:hypothetical protein